MSDPRPYNRRDPDIDWTVRVDSRRVWMSHEDADELASTIHNLDPHNDATSIPTCRHCGLEMATSYDADLRRVVVAAPCQCGLGVWEEAPDE